MKSSYRVLKETYQKIVFDLECENQGLQEDRRTLANLSGPSNAVAVAQPRRKWAIRVRNNIKHDKTVCAIAYSSDGFLLASGNKNTTRLSNAVTGRKLPIFPMVLRVTVSCEVFAFLMTASGRLRLANPILYVYGMWPSLTCMADGKVISKIFTPWMKVCVRG